MVFRIDLSSTSSVVEYGRHPFFLLSPPFLHQEEPGKHHPLSLSLSLSRSLSLSLSAAAELQNSSRLFPAIENHSCARERERERGREKREREEGGIVTCDPGN